MGCIRTHTFTFPALPRIGTPGWDIFSSTEDRKVARACVEELKATGCCSLPPDVSYSFDELATSGYDRDLVRIVYRPDRWAEGREDDRGVVVVAAFMAMLFFVLGLVLGSLAR